MTYATNKVIHVRLRGFSKVPSISKDGNLCRFYIDIEKHRFYISIYKKEEEFSYSSYVDVSEGRGRLPFTVFHCDNAEGFPVELAKEKIRLMLDINTLRNQIIEHLLDQGVILMKEYHCLQNSVSHAYAGEIDFDSIG